ncbi:hypothetical protein NL108_003491 [Boleophthalmus pectinirostris]|nr:hypothetical protein NL108_003491 [Boleophthalmus pectinirostris]
MSAPLAPDPYETTLTQLTLGFLIHLEMVGFLHFITRKEWLLMGNYRRDKAQSCGGVVQGLNGTIESPGFPHGYPNYANCTWLIITGERNRIQLTFVTLALEEDFDIVSVYDGQPSPGNLKMR